MKTAGNLSLCFAFLLFAYQLIPNLPRLRAAIMRSGNGPLGALYVLLFVLIPRFFRRLIAAIMLWVTLQVATAAAVQAGALDWLGFARLPQHVLMSAACFAMAEITVLITLKQEDAAFEIPVMVRALTPWASYALQLIVMLFAFVSLNPSISGFVPALVYRGLLMAAFALALPIGAVLFQRWITPAPSSPAVTLSL